MTVTLDLPPHVERAYLAEAQARGLPLEALMREVLLAQQPYSAAEMPPEEWVREFKAWTRSHSDLPVLSDEAISRESIYNDRGLQMATLADTNILLRSLHPEHPHYSIAENALSALRLRNETLCVAAQNLIEFWAVATRSRGDPALG